MTAPLSTKHRASANITRAQCVAMLAVSSEDFAFLLKCGMPSLLNATGKGLLFNVGRVTTFVSEGIMVGVVQGMQARQATKRSERLAKERARGKAQRDAKKLEVDDGPCRNCGR